MALAHMHPHGRQPGMVGAQPCIGRRLEHDADMCPVLQNALHGLLGTGDLDVVAHIAMGFDKILQHRRHHHVQGALAQHQVQMA